MQSKCSSMVETIAEAVRWALMHGTATPDAIEQHRLVVSNLANSLSNNIPGFDRERFMKACGNLEY